MRKGRPTVASNSHDNVVVTMFRAACGNTPVGVIGGRKGIGFVLSFDRRVVLL